MAQVKFFLSMKEKEIKVKEISKNMFNMFMLFTKSPNINFFCEELEYYSNEDNSIIGVVLLDLTDKNFNYVMLVRDEHKQFRAVDVKIDFEAKQEAAEQLKNSIKWHTGQNLKEVKQNVSRKGIELFKILVSRDKIHPYFTRLDKDEQLIPSKKAIIEIAHHFHDIDKNFVEQLQSINGFDARLWELYLFTAFTEQKFLIQRTYERPDFIIEKFDIKIGVEAVTLGRDKHNPPSYIFYEKQIPNTQQIADKIKNEAPLRYGSALYSKLSKKYWSLPHLINKPFLISVADFHDNASMTWSYTSLIEYLYGQREVVTFSKDGAPLLKTEEVGPYTKASGTKINSGFFYQKDTENLSGVLFSTTGTISKFTRMGIQAGFRSKNQLVLRVGEKYDPNSNAFASIPFSYYVDETCNESWSEGLHLFHNPLAKHPIDIELFPDIAHHKLEDKRLLSWTPSFVPFSSININIIFR